MGTADGRRCFTEQRLLWVQNQWFGEDGIQCNQLGESARISLKLFFPAAPSHLGDRLIPDICLVALYFSKLLHIHYLHWASRHPREVGREGVIIPVWPTRKQVPKGYMTHPGSHSYLVERTRTLNVFPNYQPYVPSTSHVDSPTELWRCIVDANKHLPNEWLSE